jgi:hypothetical protein
VREYPSSTRFDGADYRPSKSCHEQLRKYDKRRSFERANGLTVSIVIGYGLLHAARSRDKINFFAVQSQL